MPNHNDTKMSTVREKIAQLPPDSQKRIEEMTEALIAEEKVLRESNTKPMESERISSLKFTARTWQS